MKNVKAPADLSAPSQNSGTRWIPAGRTQPEVSLAWREIRHLGRLAELIDAEVGALLPVRRLQAEKGSRSGTGLPNQLTLLPNSHCAFSVNLENVAVERATDLEMFDHVVHSGYEVLPRGLIRIVSV